MPGNENEARRQPGPTTGMGSTHLTGDAAVPIFRRLILDRRISHGAFRLWHYLHNRKNRNGYCWPTQRDIALDLGCKPHSLAGWTSELVNAGYLAVEKVGQKHNHRYLILPGTDLPFVMPDWATRKHSRDAQIGNATESSCCPKGHAVMPKGATPRDAQMGILSNSQVVNPMSKGETTPPALSASERISAERELEAISDRRKAIWNSASHNAWGPMYSSQEKEELQRLKNRESELKSRLGRVF